MVSSLVSPSAGDVFEMDDAMARRMMESTGKSRGWLAGSSEASAGGREEAFETVGVVDLSTDICLKDIASSNVSSFRGIFVGPAGTLVGAGAVGREFTALLELRESIPSARLDFWEL